MLNGEQLKKTNSKRKNIRLVHNIVNRTLSQQKSSMKPYTSNFKHFLIVSYQLPKIYLHFYNQKSLTKPDTFYFNPPFFLFHLYPLHHVIILLNFF